MKTIYKSIFIDLDGTLLNSKKTISRENAAAIKTAITKGVKIIICSGRIFSGALVFAKQLDIKGPLISCNGALIKDIETEEIIYSNHMKLEACQKAIDVCHKYKIYFHVYIGDTLYTERLEFSSLFYWNKNKELPEDKKVDIQLVKNIDELIKDEKVTVLKIVVISKDKEILQKCRKEVSFIKDITITSSDPINFEIMNYGVNKGNGIKIVAEKLNILKNEIIAIGDNENDIQMFDYAGVKVAMGNAENKIKEIADYITLNNDENGVGEVIRKYIK